MKTFIYKIEGAPSFAYPGSGIVDLKAINKKIPGKYEPTTVMYFRDKLDNRLSENQLFHGVFCLLSGEEQGYMAIGDEIFAIDPIDSPKQGTNEPCFDFQFECEISPAEMRKLCDKYPASFVPIPEKKKSILLYRKEVETVPTWSGNEEFMMERPVTGPLIVQDSMWTGAVVVLQPGVNLVSMDDYTALSKQFEKLAKSGEVVKYEPAIKESKSA